MREFLRHFFIPRESNNHRSRLLHHQSLIFLITFLFLGQFLFSFLRTNFSSVLGTSFNISSQELLLLVNQKRQAQGLSALVMDEQLSSAAYSKANDMFTKNYWAHNSPDGLTPWVFIKGSGYQYIYAGENLARGFTTSPDVVNAWMASPSHRDNILSQNYKDIGFAIVPGKLLGEDTVLVVEMFGTSNQPIAKKVETTREAVQTSSPLVQNKEVLESPKKVFATSTVFASSAKNQALIDSSFVTRNIGLFILMMFILALVLDMIIVERKKIVRLAGHNFDHILFLGGIMVIILLLSGGIVI